MDTIKRKLTSRKMWIALAGVIVGLAAIMGAGEAEIATVAGAITGPGPPPGPPRPPGLPPTMPPRSSPPLWPP